MLIPILFCSESFENDILLKTSAHVSMNNAVWHCILVIVQVYSTKVVTLHMISLYRWSHTEKGQNLHRVILCLYTFCMGALSARVLCRVYLHDVFNGCLFFLFLFLQVVDFFKRGGGLWGHFAYFNWW